MLQLLVIFWRKHCLRKLETKCIRCSHTREPGNSQILHLCCVIVQLIILHVGDGYLFYTSTSGSQEDHTVPVVDVGSDRGQSVPALGEHCPTRHQLGPPQGLVYIQATEVIIDGNRLWAERQDVSPNIEKKND